MNKKINVLVVDDSAFMRKLITQILEEDEEIKVIDTAKDGKEAFKKVIELSPDVVTLDLEMPGMDGLTTLGYIMSEKSTPVIMLSAYTKRGAETTLQALEYGAVDFVLKPSGEISIDIKKIKDELIEKIKAASKIDVSKLTFILPENVQKEHIDIDKKGKNIPILVIIIASTGGPRALTEIIPKIPRNLPAAFIVIQHMSAGFTKTLAERLNSQSLLKVKEAEDKEKLKLDHIYIAPGNFHLELIKMKDEYEISLNKKPQRLGVRPCGDITVFSAVKNFSGDIIEVILTGMGKDGTEGAEQVKKNKKGVIFAQNKDTSVIFGMPKSVIEKGLADKVLPLSDIPRAIVKKIEELVKV